MMTLSPANRWVAHYGTTPSAPPDTASCRNLEARPESRLTWPRRCLGCSPGRYPSRQFSVSASDPGPLDFIDQCRSCLRLIVDRRDPAAAQDRTAGKDRL